MLFLIFPAIYTIFMYVHCRNIANLINVGYYPTLQIDTDEYDHPQPPIFQGGRDVYRRKTNEL